MFAFNTVCPSISIVVFFRSRFPVKICALNSAAMSLSDSAFFLLRSSASPPSPDASPVRICSGMRYVLIGAADALPSAKSATVCCTSDCKLASSLRRRAPSGPRSISTSRSASLGGSPASLLKMASTPNLSIPYRSFLSTPSSASLCLVLPRLTICSRKSFFSARCCIRSSTVPAVTSRYTCTGFFCPILCTRAIACVSTCGFQSESKSTHVSAVCKFTPRPPARVESKNANIGDPGRLNAAMSMLRCTRFVDPSRRAYWYPRRVKKSCRMSSMLVNCEKRTTRWPRSLSRLRMRSRTASFPDASTSSSTGTPSSGTSVPANRNGWLQHLRSCIRRDWSFRFEPAASEFAFFSPSSSRSIASSPLLSPPLAPSSPPPECFRIAAASAAVRVPLSRISRRRYQNVCAGLSGHMIFVSVFSGRDTSTSPLTLRSTNGFMR